MSDQNATKNEYAAPGSVADAMSRLSSPGTMVLTGTVVNDMSDAVTLQIGSSLFDVPRQYIHVTREVGSGSAGRTVELTVASNAQLLQRVIATPYHAIAAASGMIMAAACQCACACNCACDGGSIQSINGQPVFRVQTMRTF